MYSNVTNVKSVVRGNLFNAKRGLVLNAQRQIWDQDARLEINKASVLVSTNWDSDMIVSVQKSNIKLKTRKIR